MATTRWGIASCGLISADFASALQHLSAVAAAAGAPQPHRITAVAARSLDAAAAFAARFGVTKYYDRYEDLCTDPDVDVVYVGMITPGHAGVGAAAVRAGKAVLCEKPLCIDVKLTKELVLLAQGKKVFLMEAVWSRCLPVYRELQRRLAAEEVGQVTQALATFGVPIGNVARVMKKELGGGSMLDIGIYCLQFILLVMGPEPPLQIQAMGLLNEDGVEGDVNVSLRFSGDRMASFTLSTRATLPNTACVVGTGGTITLGCPFWTPLSLTGPSGDFEAPLEPSELKYNFMNSQGLKYEAEEVRKCLQEGLTESALVPHALTLLLADLMHSIRDQLGVTC